MGLGHWTRPRSAVRDHFSGQVSGGRIPVGQAETTPLVSISALAPQFPAFGAQFGPQCADTLGGWALGTLCPGTIFILVASDGGGCFGLLVSWCDYVAWVCVHSAKNPFWSGVTEVCLRF